MREVVSGKERSALRLIELDVRRVGGRGEIVGEAAERVGNFRPADVNGFGQEMRAAGMQCFDGAAGCVELGFDRGESAERGGLAAAVAWEAGTGAVVVVAFRAEACDNDAARREQLRARVPDEVDGTLEERDTAVDV